MDPKELILNSIQMGDAVLKGYLTDLEDEDLILRPILGMNHIAWQLGHLIASERHFVELVRPGISPVLPQNFELAHGRDKTDLDDPHLYYPKLKYLELLNGQRTVTLDLLTNLPEAELDRSEPNFPSFAPNVGKILNMVGIHTLMHVGQFVATRRKLGKPVTI